MKPAIYSTLLCCFILVAFGTGCSNANTPAPHTESGSVETTDQDRTHEASENTGKTVNKPVIEAPNISVIVMLLLMAGIICLFFFEPLPLYVLALAIPVLLVVLQKWTGISTSEAISGFSSEATVTILAMFILSEGIRQSGLIQILGDEITALTGKSIYRQLGVITGLSGPTAGIINNTPVVAIFIPMVSNMAERLKTSPSKLMIPLSFASMMGGTLTLIGSSTNLLASDISARMLDHPISFFEFSAVGLVILAVGSIYLVFAGPALLRDRLDAERQLAEEYEMGNLLTEVVLDDSSEYIQSNVGDAVAEMDVDIDVVQIIREDDKFMEPLQVKTLRSSDRLVVRTNRENLLKLLQTEGFNLYPRQKVSERHLHEPEEGRILVETVVPKGSFLEGQTMAEVNFLERYDTTVMAIRRGEELTHRSMEDLEIQAGDVLLLFATETTRNRLRQNPNFIVVEEIETSTYRWSKMPLSLGTLATVVGLAAFGVTSIAISALAGCIFMVATGCIEPKDVHEAVDWEVIFLLAGLIPLGMAMEESGAAEFVAMSLLPLIELLPPLGILASFYLLTAVITNLIHKNASIVLMIPIAVDSAMRLGVEPFPVLLTVMFAASTAFLTPVGNQTNLMVYGPGGYRFGDFFRVGAPLQLLLAVVTPVAVSMFWTI